MAKFRKIGILTSGGDAPGMNAAIRAIARKALAEGIEVVGINEGYSGLINGNIRPLDSRAVSNIITTGGTMLYSSRCPEFKTPEGMAKAIKTCEENQSVGNVVYPALIEHKSVEHMRGNSVSLCVFEVKLISGYYFVCMRYKRI